MSFRPTWDTLNNISWRKQFLRLLGVLYMKRTKHEIINDFNSYNFHDDLVVGINISPSDSSRKHSNIEIEFKEICYKKQRFLTLKQCANVSFVADFDVLTSQAFCNTQGVIAIDDQQQIENLLNEQLDQLNVETCVWCDEPEHPTRKKLLDVSPFILFVISFFGGTLKVVAKNFKAKGPRIAPD